jgi:ankyrin repeat protein
MKTLLKAHSISIVLFFLFIAGSSQEIIDAVKKGDLGKVKELIIKDPLLVKTKTNTGETPLLIAARSGHAEIALFLLEKGADPEAKDASNNTPLTNAIRSKDPETVKVIGDNGANVNNRGLWNFLPIQVAAEFTSNDIVNYLIDKGAEIPVAQGQDSYQLLNAACSKGLTELFEKMIEKGFDLQLNQYTRNLLHSAAAGGSDIILEVLLSKGFKVMSGDGYGWSPLHSAAEKGNLKAVELLLDKGADINDRNASGRTPYNLADFYRHKEVCEFLMSKGADTSGQKFPVLTGNYLGQKEPEKSPRVFAPDIVTTKYAIHGNIVFTPDGREAYWSGFFPSKNSSEEKGQILSMKSENGQWSKPELAPFSKIGFDDDSPFISPDGKKLFFLSRRPVEKGSDISTKENIWFMTRESNGWSQPQPLEIVNSLDMHWQVSVDKNGNLYFGARDPKGLKFGEIFCSRFVNREYQKPERLSDKVNSENIEGSPYISPDGDYLLFDRASKFGHQMGLYISFLNKDGFWSEAKPIAEIAGIDPYSQCGNLTHDGRFLFYIAGYTNEFGVYWVNAEFINIMKTESLTK